MSPPAQTEHRLDHAAGGPRSPVNAFRADSAAMSPRGHCSHKAPQSQSETKPSHVAM